MKPVSFPSMRAKQQDLCLYSLVILPCRTITDKVTSETALLYNKWGVTAVKPQITIAIFEAKESMESTIIRWIERILKTTKSFTVTLNNYGVQPPNLLYLRILEPKPFVQLANNLKVVDQYVRANACPPAYFTRAPKLVIDPIPPVELPVNELIEFTQRTFAETFPVTNLTLIRSDGAGGEEKVINIFSLNPNHRS